MKALSAYEQFLQTEFWKSLRRQCLERDKKCVKCQSKIDMQAHHTIYRLPWTKTRLEDLETLCTRCHKKHHGFEVKPMFNLNSQRVKNSLNQRALLKYESWTGLGMPLNKGAVNRLNALLDDCSPEHFERAARVLMRNTNRKRRLSLTHKSKPPYLSPSYS